MTTKRRAACTLIAVALVLGAGGCGGSDTASTTPATTTAATQSTISTTVDAHEERQLRVAVTHGTASGDTRPTVTLGSTVMLHITSDTADTAHLHGYDKEIELAAGKESMFEFTADIPGRFELELHHSGTKAMELTVK
jgi:hypothetical protein